MPLTQPVPLSQLVRTGSTITIEELESTIPGGKPRRIVLVGPALPRKGGASWEGDSRLVTKWYPGNGAEGTQQNLGPTEAPSDWNGVWNRTRMGRSPSMLVDEQGTEIRIVDPFELYEALDAIRMGGARLRVTWAVFGRRLAGAIGPGTDRPVDRKIVREGRMKRLKIQPETEVDIPWDMSFEWVSRGGRQEKATDVRREEDLVLASNAVAASVIAMDFAVDAKIVSLKSAKRLSASKLTLGQLERLANAPKLLVDNAVRKLRFNVNQFKRVADIARKMALAPVAVENSILDLARNTTAVANQFIHQMGQTPPELLTNRQKVSDLARATKHFARISNGMVASARAGASLEDKLRQVLVAGSNQGTIPVKESSTTRAGDIVGVYVCKQGDTPTRVSSKYYGSPDHGPEILRANRLPTFTPTFRRGQILVIPALVRAARPQ